jgi:biotin-(acetyl-CoA carboxylase) ligase
MRFEFLNGQIEFLLPNQQLVTGKFSGITPDGYIEISIDGTTQTFSSGHILGNK